MDQKDMNQRQKALEEALPRCKAHLLERYPSAKDRLLADESMSAHSTFRVGGPADLVFMPSSREELVFAVQAAKQAGIPFTILGHGSNILVADKGIRGLVILLGEKFSTISREDDVLLAADAGALLSTVAKFAAKEGLTGMEFAAGIPGSVGGAVYMNAGAYDGCMADIVAATQGFDPETGELFMLETPEAHQFAYRQSHYGIHMLIVARVWLRLRKGDKEEIEKKMAEFSVKRRNSQPLEYPSAGSTFKRPVGDYAGRLIEAAGLKGCRVGGACVSPKHAGFIVNDDKATAADILELIHLVQARISEEYGVIIDPEVRILGEW